MAYAYALIHEENGMFGISFPDFPGCISGGSSVDEALRKGAQALNFHIEGMIEDHDPLPLLRSLKDIQADPEFAQETGAWVLVPVEMPGKAVRVNFTIEESLLGAVDAAAKASGLTRSAFLAAAAKEKIRA